MRRGGERDLTVESTMNVILDLGKRLGFEVGKEVGASQAAWVDVAWFDRRFNYGPVRGKYWERVNTRLHPVLPIAGFEVEGSANSKPLKGSVANFNDLGAWMNVIVLTEENIPKLRARGHQKEPDSKLWDWLVKRTTQWIYEARPPFRVVVMTEVQLSEWARQQGVGT